MDTTTDRASVAVVSEGAVLGEVRVHAPAHSRRLMPAVDFLLASLALAPLDVDGFAVTAGPGSFTGLRIGLACVQGLALAAGRPCVGLGTLDVLAARLAGAAPALVAAMDAHRGEVYVATYDAQARPTAEPRTVAPESAFMGLPRGAAFIGNGAERYRDAIRAAVPDAAFPERSTFLAATLGRLAEPILAAGGGVAPSALRPLYLRGTGAAAPRGG